jgi:hypothetical protein
LKDGIIDFNYDKTQPWYRSGGENVNLFSVRCNILMVGWTENPSVLTLSWI